MNSAFNIILKYLAFLFLINTLFLCLSISTASAGIIGEIGDIGVKFAVINLWKGLGGLALLLFGMYAIANRRPFRYKIMAVASGVMIIAATIVGIFLFIGEFWPILSAVISKTAALFR